MLELSVHRQNDTLLDPNDASTKLFYDENVTVRLKSPKPCSVHLYVTVLGSLQDREREHSVVIYDEDLPRCKESNTLIHIRHPRSPLQHPHLEIVATAHHAAIEDQEEDQGKKPQTKYLTPFAPVSVAKSSFLVPFSPTWNKVEPDDEAKYGSGKKPGHQRDISTASGIDLTELKREQADDGVASLSSSANPKQPANDANTTESSESQDDGIEVVRWKSPLVQALELEIRSLRPALERDRVIAEVDLVSGAYDVCVTTCDVDLQDGLANLMGVTELPKCLGAQEVYAMCYNLQLRAAAQLSAVPASRKPLSLTLECEVLLSERGDKANPKTTTVWMPIVDFEGTQGPLPKTPALNLPLNSPIAFSNSNAHLGGGPSSTTLDLVSGPRQNSSSNLSLMGGVSIMITGPQFVTVGDTFEWHFKIVNRSQRHRVFTITFGSIVRDPLRKELLLPIDPMTSMSSYNSDVLRRRAATHYRNIGANRGIVPLCQELKIGNLAPHVCFETKIQLYALHKGTHTIETARIEDLHNRDSYDVGSLLEVIVLPGSGDS